MKMLLLISIVLIGSHLAFAQTICSGTTLFTESKCAGDELNPAEKELYKIINEYRAQNNLPPVPISDALSIVANRHLLDLTLNVKSLSHGWSNCPYDTKNEKTWNCVFNSPQRLKTNYAGQGFENLYRNVYANASPSLALEAWKKSPMHNNLILNLDIWKNTKFDALGVAIIGNYAAIWFGSSGNKDVNYGKTSKGLGVSFDDLVEGLTSILSIQKTSSVADSEKWVGLSSDKNIRLEIYGREKDISQTSMSLSVRLSKNAALTPQSRSAVSRFLQNIAENWNEREKWLDSVLDKLAKTPKLVQTVNVGNKSFEASMLSSGELEILVKPNTKPAAKEMF